MLFRNAGLHPVRTRSAHTWRSEEHTSELQSRQYLVCRLLLEKKKKNQNPNNHTCNDKEIFALSNISRWHETRSVFRKYFREHSNTSVQLAILVTIIHPLVNMD